MRSKLVAIGLGLVALAVAVGILASVRQGQLDHAEQFSLDNYGGYDTTAAKGLQNTIEGTHGVAFVIGIVGISIAVIGFMKADAGMPDGDATSQLSGESQPRSFPVVPAAAEAPMTNESLNAVSILDEISKAHGLFEKGAITQDEFEFIKAQKLRPREI